MDPREDKLQSAQELGEKLAALLGSTEWQLDAPIEELPPAPGGEPEEKAAVAAVVRPSRPPLAEAANEATVPPSPLQILEALLFVGGAPLTPENAAEAIRGLTEDQFRDCIESLNRVYRGQNRPYTVVHGPKGYVLRITARYTAVREKIYGGPREARLNQPALDVLSMVAYRQPVGKSEIDNARGAESGSVLRQLVRLGLIAVAQRADSESREVLYGTTPRFLEVFRLRDLDDLPQLGTPQKIE